MSVSAQLNELQLKVEYLDYDNKDEDGIITMDILSEQNQDAKNKDHY